MSQTMTVPRVECSAWPAALQQHPCLGQWLRPLDDGCIEAYTGKVDIGQGISHALRLIVADELRLPAGQIRMVRADTHCSPDEAVTSGSLSVQHSGAALRCAAAYLREHCRARFADCAAVPVSTVKLAGGRFCAEGAQISASYDDLIVPEDLTRIIQPVSAPAPLDSRPYLESPGRPEVDGIVFGRFRYLQDMTWPQMAHGMVLRPKVLPARVDESLWLQRLERLRALSGGIQVLRDGLLVGLLGPSWSILQQALQAWNRWEQDGSLWQTQAHAPDPGTLADWLRAQPHESTTVLERLDSEEPAPGAHWHEAEYQRPYLQHASIGLCCAVARWEVAPHSLRVWSHSQSIFNLRRDLALALDLPLEQVRVSHAEGAGCYGHNGADDVAFDAAWLARHATGRHVRVQWSRAAELGHAPLGPAMLVRIQAAAQEGGRLVQWNQDVWSQGHGTRPGRDKTPALLGAWQMAVPFAVPMAVNAALSAGGGSERNAVPPYELPAVRVRNHRVLRMPLRVSALRALGAHVNVFAAECFMDELAQRFGQDPLQYRLAHLQGGDPDTLRARAVLLRVAELAGWSPGAAPDAGEGWGRGIAYARYKNTGAFCAVVAQVRVLESVQVQKLWIAADLGQVVHPDGTRNQIEGGALQSTSWTLYETAQWTDEGVQSDDWARYPIARFTQLPPVEVTLMERPDQPSLGAGECACGPVAAALGNAVANATGVRLRSMPLTFERLLACAQAS